MEFFFRLAWPRVGCSLISIYLFLMHVRVDVTPERERFPPAPSCLCAQPVCHRLITGLGWGVRWGGGEGLFWGQILQRCKNAALAKRREILELSAVITPPPP